MAFTRSSPSCSPVLHSVPILTAGIRTFKLLKGSPESHCIQELKQYPIIMVQFGHLSTLYGVRRTKKHSYGQYSHKLSADAQKVLSTLKTQITSTSNINRLRALRRLPMWVRRPSQGEWNGEPTLPMLRALEFLFVRRFVVPRYLRGWLPVPTTDPGGVWEDAFSWSYTITC